MAVLGPLLLMKAMRSAECKFKTPAYGPRDCGSNINKMGCSPSDHKMDVVTNPSSRHEHLFH